MQTTTGDSKSGGEWISSLELEDVLERPRRTSVDETDKTELRRRFAAKELSVEIVEVPR
jgi:hypothetical protein